MLTPETMQRPRVKMCGTTRLADAQAAVACGVDALGFIFYPKSPRYIEPAAAAAIIATLPPFVSRVGVLVDASPELIAQAVESGISHLQLHGKETPEECYALRARYRHCGLIKAFRVSPATTAALFSPYVDCVDAFLLDTYVPGAKGGTGLVFDWRLLAGWQLAWPLILAGGLTPENVADALRLARPYAIDINSGVESAPGVKDHDRLRALLQVVARFVSAS